ncbi:MAG: ATP-binding protein [Pseudomonadota bacterium]|nr:ATP-binding protein [Pseudomonadota bacterium]
MYIERTMEQTIRQAAAQFPVLLVTGARQVGKTTLLAHLAGTERAYVTLDDPLVCEMAVLDPAQFMQRYPYPVLIDEVQYAPGLLPYIKMAVDRDRKPGAFWLTGSQQFHLMKGVSESLAGRVAVLRLAGLTRREIRKDASDAPAFLPGENPEKNVSLDLKELYRLIWRGGFPALALNAATDWELFYGSYVQTYLQRDVRDLARVGDETAFLRFMRAAAARTGQLLNMADLARDADVSSHTAKSWLSILEASGIVYLLEPWYANQTKRLVKAPKLFMLDTGLAAYLTGWTSPETLEAGAMAGAMLESWVMAELLKSWWSRGKRAPFYFYRDRDAREIDLVIARDGRLYPVEIKKTASPNRGDVSAFKALAKSGSEIGPGGVICLVEASLPLGEGARSIPIGEI